MGWQRSFDDPIPVPKGKPLATLRDAATYITRLPKAEQNLPEWQTAIACLIGAAGLIVYDRDRSPRRDI
jgi:hypothetical protein